MYYRSDTALIVINVENITVDTEPWDIFEGGEKKSAGLKVFPGGMAEQIELGGTPEREAIKVSRKWSDVLVNAFAKLDEGAGNAHMEVSVTNLNALKVPTGPTTTWSGILLECKQPNRKAGPSEEIYLELTMGPHGPIVVR